MTLEATPGSVATDGYLRVAFVPYAVDTDPKSVATLTAATTKALTYSLTPSGFNRTTNEERINDERLTLKQILQKAGRVTHELSVQYVFGAEDDVAFNALKNNTKGWIVARYAVPNETEWEAAQTVDIIPIECGYQGKDAPTANGVWTITQNLVVTGVVEPDAVLVV